MMTVTLGVPSMLPVIKNPKFELQHLPPNTHWGFSESYSQIPLKFCCLLSSIYFEAHICNLSRRCRWPLTNFTMYAVNQWLFVLIAPIACFGCFLLFAWIRRRGHKKATHSLFPLLLPFPFPFSCLIFSSIAT